MSRWFRFYDDAINDPKILKLSDKLHRVWIGILCVASKNDGQLPALDDLALMIRMKPEKLADAIKSLMIAGLIDEKEAILSPHNWSGRQYKSDVSNERVKRFRERKCNGDVTLQKRPQTTEAEQITEAEKKDTSLRSDDWPKDFGDQFWQAYPRKTEKLAAMKKLSSVRKSGLVTFVDLMIGVKRYAAAGTEIKFTKHPTTWLNAGCWADEIQTGGDNGNRTGNPRTSGHDAILAVAARKARELDRNDDLAGAADPPGFAFGNGAHTSGSRGNSASVEPDRADHQRIEPDDQRIREGEIIPPDKNAAGLPGRRQFV